MANGGAKSRGMKDRWKRTARGLSPILAKETVNYQGEVQTEELKLSLQEFETQERKQCTQQLQH